MEGIKRAIENRGGPTMMMAKAEQQQKRPEVSATSKADCRSTPFLNPEQWVEAHGDALFGFAALRVRDYVIAQDLVQETFLAALKAKDSFAGRSSERAWLFGILRNKLIDYYRLQSRETPFSNPEDSLPEERAAFEAGGLGKDGWLKGVTPKPWETPEEALISREFQDTLKSCLSRLPTKLAQVFLLREIDNVPSDEICKDLGLSPNNVWVMLHRARLGLRRCLEVHWFGNKKSGK